MINIRMSELKLSKNTNSNDERRSPLILIKEISDLSDELQTEDRDRSYNSVNDRAVLTEIAKREGRSQLEIGRAVNLDKSTVSVIMKRLEEKGFIYRETDVLDHRASRVYITEQGREAAEAIREKMHCVEKTAISGLTTNEYETLIRLLNKVRDNIANRPVE